MLSQGDFAEATEFDVHRLSIFATGLQDQQVQVLAAWDFCILLHCSAFVSTMEQAVKCLSDQLLSVSVQMSKRQAAAHDLEAEALSILVDTFRLAATAVGANNLQESPSASKLLQ